MNLANLSPHINTDIYLYKPSLSKYPVLVSYSMRGEEPVVVETLKARAFPEGSHDYLLEFLRLYRDAVQVIVDRIWGINERLSTLKLHNGYEVKLKLITPKERVEKFKGWRNYELVVEYDGSEFWVLVYFKRAIKLVKPRTIMAIDLNFDNVTLAIFTLNGRLVKLKKFKTPHRKILTHRIWIERIQRRYSRSWRFIKAVRGAIERHGERIKNISWDYSHKVGDSIAELALKYRSVITLEDLNELRENNKKDKEFNKRLGLWFYLRMQFCVEYEARERNLEVVKVDPKRTSSKCPRCGGKLFEDGYRVLRCRRCCFIGDRDVVATLNLYKKFIRDTQDVGSLGWP